MPVAIPHFDAQNQVQGASSDLSLGKELKLEIRPATVADVHGMSALINHYASSNVMLARGRNTCTSISRIYMVVTAPARDKDHEVVVAWPVAPFMFCGRIWRKSGPLRFMRAVRARTGEKKKLFRPLLNAAAPCKSRGFCIYPGNGILPQMRFYGIQQGRASPLSGLSAANAPNFIAATKWA